MLAAYVLLLNQYTDDEDVVVGSVYANRERVEAENVIGILANTIVLRVNLLGAQTFKDVLRQVRQVCLDAYTYQVSPELIREDFSKRGEERDRLFDVWFQLDTEHKEQLSMDGLQTSWYSEGKEVARFELSLTLAELEEGITVKIEYNDAIFTSQTTAQMLEDYVALLKLMTADPDKNLASIAMASTAAVANLEV
jgi:non-ribosomal peptide synthetase component F